MSDEQITRDDLFFPAIGEARQIWTFVHDLTGAVALWAVQQSPYDCPDNLEIVVKQLAALCAPDFNEVGMREFGSFKEVEDYLAPRLRSIPEYMAWNERKNGNNAPLQFTSRYDGPGNPDDDFIDLGALERNAAMHIVQQSALT